MILVHKVIDAFMGQGRSTLVEIPGGLPEKKQLRNAARVISKAQCFDFGHLPFEDRGNSNWALPNITRDERDMWAMGLLPLPYPICWYEFRLGMSRSGLLVMELSEEPDNMFVQRVDYCTQDRLFFDGITLTVHKTDPDPTLKDLDGNRADDPSAVGWKIDIKGNAELVKDKTAQQYRQDAVLNGPIAVYLTMMLHSRSTLTEPEDPPKFLNRKRVSKGLTPLPAHRVVTIVPRHYRYEKGEGGVERRLPRLHWRRSHFRHFEHQTPNAKYFPEIEYHGKKGWWITAIARMLVGKAELGQVSHEYRLGP